MIANKVSLFILFFLFFIARVLDSSTISRKTGLIQHGLGGIDLIVFC